jgi:hypothetical protein
MIGPVEEINLMVYLKKYKPYLHSLELEVARVKNATGFGEASISCFIKSGEVVYDEALGVVRSSHIETEPQKLKAKGG